MKQPKEQLESLRPRSLSSDERESAWQAIESRIALMPKTEPKPRSLIMTPMPFAPIFLALLLLVSGSVAVTAASDSALPGDALYPVDRAVENVRLQLATSADAKAKLQVKFAGERFDEAQKAVIRARVKASASARTNTNASAGSDSEDTIRESARAELALKTAIETLTRVRTELQAKGNVQAAAQIGIVLTKLADLTEQHLEVLDRVKVELEGDTNATLRIRSMENSLKLDLNALINVDVEDELETETNLNTNTVFDSDDDVSGNVNANTNVNVNVNANANVNTNTSLDIGSAVLISIEAEVHVQESTEVHITYLGGEAETRISGKTRAQIVSELATKLNRSSLEIDAVLTVRSN